MKDFLAKGADLKAASEKTKAEAAKGQAAFKAAVFGSLVKTCKSCHDAYRIKKEKKS
jgi:cytochrome c556